MSKIKMGRLTRVENEGRTFGADPEYIAVQVEDENGKNNRCLLFTEEAIKIAEERALKNKEDLTVLGFWQDLLT